jgi:hypothetical protein
MNLSLLHLPASVLRKQRASAVLIVLALLACIAIILAATSTALTVLDREIHRLDQHQLKKYGQGNRH